MHVDFTHKIKSLMICLSNGCNNGSNHTGYCKYHRSRNHIVSVLQQDWRQCTECDHGYSSINALIEKTDNVDTCGRKYSDSKDTADYINKLILHNRKIIGNIMHPLERTKELNKYGIANCSDTKFGFCFICNGYKLGHDNEPRWNAWVGGHFF